MSLPRNHGGYRLQAQVFGHLRVDLDDMSLPGSLRHWFKVQRKSLP